MSQQSRYPSTVISSDEGEADGSVWSGLSDLVSVNGQYAEAENGNYSDPAQTEWLKCTNFGFSLAGGVVTSVSCEVTRKRLSTSGDVEDLEVRLVLGGAITGDNLAQVGNWPTSNGVATYTLPALTRSQLEAADTGIAIRCTLDPAAAEQPDPTTAQVDHVAIIANYTPLPPPPLPGTGGLNTGGAFLAAFIQQQMGG
jgi:hypothetical protein